MRALKEQRDSLERVHLDLWPLENSDHQYLSAITDAKEVGKDARFFSRSRHINLPVIFGMNNKRTPYFMATEVYDSEGFHSVTLRNILKDSDAF